MNVCQHLIIFLTIHLIIMAKSTISYIKIHRNPVNGVFIKLRYATSLMHKFC